MSCKRHEETKNIGIFFSRLLNLGRHLPNVSTILLLFFFFNFSTIIPRAHFPPFPREILDSRSKENPSPNLACTKFFYNSSPKSLWNLCFLTRVNGQRGRIVEELLKYFAGALSMGCASRKNCRQIVERFCARSSKNISTILPQFFPAVLPDEGQQNLSIILPQFFHNFSTILTRLVHPDWLGEKL
jgi:hypothetical protein